MTVVTSAMITISVNSSGLSRPFSRPTLRMISSVNPRVFISRPRELACQCGTFCSLAPT